MSRFDRKTFATWWQRFRTEAFRAEHLRRAFTRNLSLKLLSLIIAFGLWTFVNFGERDAEESLQVPLELRNIPVDLMITSPRVNFIDVRVSGPRTLLGRIDKDRLVIGLDLNGVRPGPALFRLGADLFNLPRGVQVVRINPAQVTIELEAVAQKSVPVRLHLTGRPSPDLVVEDVKVSPETVVVSGPQSDIQSIDSVTTEPLDLTNAEAGTIERELPLEAVGEYVSLSAPRVAAQVRVDEVEVTRELRRVPIEVRNTTYRVRLRPETIQLTLRGPKRLVADLEPSLVPVYIDAGREGVGERQVKPTVELPTGVDLVAMEPNAVRLTLSSQRRGARGG
jgi:YbbR domain-containing protein